MHNSKLVQMMTRVLLFDVVNSDLRKMQKDILHQEKQRLELIVKQAKKDGVKAKDLCKAKNVLKMLSGEITPYSERKVATAADLLDKYAEALETLSVVYTERDLSKVQELHEIIHSLLAQRDNMLKASQQIRPEHFLLLTRDFIQRYYGCAEYNNTVATFVYNSLDASNFQQLLVTTTTFLVFLDYARPHADFSEDGLSLFQFKQDFDTVLNENKQVSAMHINFPKDGVYHEEIIEANKLSLERQYKRYAYIVQLQQKLTRKYISEIIFHNKAKIQAIYSNNPNTAFRLLVSTIAIRIRESCEEKLFGSVQKLFDSYVAYNREWWCVNKFTPSPLNLLLWEIAKTPITNTNFIKTFHANFMVNLKYVLAQNQELKDIVAPAAILNQARAFRLRASRKIDLEQIAIDGLTEAMNLEFEETFDAFQREVIRQKDITVFGQYTLTEDNFLKFHTTFPVIQIERRLAGAIIVGLNEPAFRLGFRLHWFLTKNERVHTCEIDEFLQTSTENDLCSTRFHMVQFGEPKQDVQDENKQMLEEVLSDLEMPHLNYMFNKIN